MVVAREGSDAPRPLIQGYFINDGITAYSKHCYVDTVYGFLNIVGSKVQRNIRRCGEKNALSLGLDNRKSKTEHPSQKSWIYQCCFLLVYELNNPY